MNARKKPEKLIALTGATGFVGGHIMDQAVKAGHRVRALTRRPQEPRAGVEWLSGAIEDDDALIALAKDTDAVIHCAGIVKASRSEDFFTINAKGVSRLLDAIVESAPGKDFHFLMLSSLAARQPHLSPYAMSKHHAEELVRARNPEFAWTIVRPPAVYGPGDMEILKLFRSMKRGFAPVAGGENNTFSLIHGRDLARCVLAALNHPAAHGALIEPDDNKAEGYTIHDVAKAAEPVFGREIKPLEVPETVLHSLAFFNELGAILTRRAPMLSRHKVREMAHPDWVVDPATLKAIPHWRPEISLDQGLAETIAWYRERGLL